MNRNIQDSTEILNSSEERAARDFEKIILPLPPAAGEETRFEMEIYARFMRHLRHVPNSRMEIKILAAIQFTADLIDIGDALVAKTLLDLGLRAPRQAFPQSFLDFIDKRIMRTSWDIGSPPVNILELSHHWNLIGEDKFFNTIPERYAVYNENNYAAV